MSLSRANTLVDTVRSRRTPYSSVSSALTAAIVATSEVMDLPTRAPLCAMHSLSERARVKLPEESPQASDSGSKTDEAEGFRKELVRKEGLEPPWPCDR